MSRTRNDFLVLKMPSGALRRLVAVSSVFIHFSVSRDFKILPEVFGVLKFIAMFPVIWVSGCFELERRVPNVKEVYASGLRDDFPPFKCVCHKPFIIR